MRCQHMMSVAAWVVAAALTTGLPIPTHAPTHEVRDTGLFRGGDGSVATSVNAVSQVRAHDAYGKLPLYFEPNRGQTDPAVKFLAHGPRQTLLLTSTEAILRFTTTEQTLRMTFVGANPAPRVTGKYQQAGGANYFIGNDPTNWRTDVPVYARVQYEDVYPGVDLMYYGTERQLEYDLVVRPGASPDRIVLRFEGADTVDIDAHGDLVLHTPAGIIRHRKPVIYQEVDGRRRAIAGAYFLKGRHRVGFRIAAYDHRHSLIIDPVIYSTFLGGLGGYDEGRAIAVDAAGNAYVTGNAWVNFPTTAGAFQQTSGTWAAFVTKLNPGGTALVYSTFLGGSDAETGHAIAVDAAGNAYVTGMTLSADFPTTTGAFQETFGGARDAFVTKLNPSGTALVYSTFLGGSNQEEGQGIAVNAAGNAYVAGVNGSTDFPTTAGAFQGAAGAAGGDAFVTKLNPGGSALEYSTSLGGGGSDGGFAIAVDATGNAYVTGFTDGDLPGAPFPITAGAFQETRSVDQADAFVTKVNAAGSALVYSTFLSGNLCCDTGLGIAVDGAGAAYVTGHTSSTDFPTTAGSFQETYGGGIQEAFVTKLNPAGSDLGYSTFLGGSDVEDGLAIAVDAAGNAFVTGWTSSPDFPTTAGQAIFGGSYDAFVTTFTSAGSVITSTYLGSGGNEIGQGIAHDAFGNIYVTGLTYSLSFPVSPGAFQSAYAGGGDGFVAKIGTASAAPTITALADQTIDEDLVPPGLAFTIADVDTPVATLIVTGNSSDTTLVPNANILLLGSDANRIVVVIPAANQFGTATITVTVSDGTATTPTSFVLTVNSVNDAPTITALADQTIDEDLVPPGLAFTVADVDTPVANLFVTGVSSDTTLVPNANILLFGSEANRTVVVIPAANQFGTTTITVTLSDGVTTTPASFLLTVNSVNDAPTISAVADQTISRDSTTGALSFSVGDVETAAGSLVVTSASSDATLVPTSAMTLGGSGSTRTITMTPALNQSGTATITLTVDDGMVTTSTSFLLTVNASPSERLLVGLGPFPGGGGWMPTFGELASNLAMHTTRQLPWATYNFASGEMHPAVGNVDTDPLDEVVIGLGNGGAGWIAVLDDADHNYALLQWIRIQWPNYTGLTGGSVWPAVGDLDGDGRAEIVAGLGPGGSGWIEIFDDATNNFAHVGWRQLDWGQYNIAIGEIHPAVADLDGDGFAEIVLGLGQGGGGWLQLLNGTAPYAHRQWLRIDWPRYQGQNGPTFPAAGDLDGDDRAEIVVGLGEGGAGYLEVFDDAVANHAFVKWLAVSWPAYNAARGETHPAIGNLDGDAAAEIAVGLGSYAANGGWVQVFDDGLTNYAPLLWLQATWQAYVAGGGPTFPAVGRLR